MSHLNKIISTQARQGEQIENIQETCQRIDECLTGNGDPEKGLVVRIDRLEQKDILRSKVFWIIIIVIFGVIIKSVAGIFV